MKRTALAIILAAFAPLAFGQADDTGAQPVRTPDRSTTCTLDSINDVCSVALEGRQGASVYVTTANLNATVTFQYSADGGTVWEQAYVISQQDWLSRDQVVFSGGAVSSSWSFSLAGGWTHVRANVTAYVSGTGTAQLRANETPGPLFVVQAGDFPWFIKVTDGIRTLAIRDTGSNDSANVALTDSTGAQQGSTANPLGTKLTDGTDTALVTAAGEQNVIVTDGGIVKDGTGDTTQANVSSGRLHVDGSGVTQPVSGTVVAAGPVGSANNDGACVSVAASTTVLASFASRKGFSLFARETNTDVVYIKMGGTATSSDFPLPAGSAYNMQAAVVYTGVIDAIAASGTQSVCVVEF